MQIESFHYFVALAKAGSFYRAAKDVFISQQGLNKAITAMESELGVKLVERSAQGVRLTSAGEKLLVHARKILSAYDSMVDDLVQAGYDTAEQVDPVAVRATYYPVQVAAGIRGGMLFSEKTSISEVSFNDLLDRAERSDGNELLFLDLHPSSRAAFEARSNLVFEPFVTTRYGIVWNKDSAPSAGKLLHRNDIVRLPLALNSQRDMAKLNGWLFRDHPLHNVNLQAASPRLLLEYVQAAPGRYAAFDSFGFHLSQLDPAMATDGLGFTALSTPESICQVGCVYDKRHRPSLRMRHALDTLKQLLAKEYADYFKKYPVELAGAPV